MPPREKQYFATLEGQELVTALQGRWKWWTEYAVSAGFAWLWRRSQAGLYGMGDKGYSALELQKHGAQGQLTKIRLNHYGNLGQHFHSMLEGDGIAYDPMAGGEKWQDAESARKARGLLENWLSDGLEGALRKAETFGTFCGHGWVATDWDARAGEAVMPDVEDEPSPDAPPLPNAAQKPPVFSGEMRRYPYAPWQVAFDPDARAPDQVDWVILKRHVNRWSLAAQFPEHRDAILGAGNGVTDDVEFRNGWGRGGTTREYGDRVALYQFRHKSNEACDGGRLVLYVEGHNTPLSADPLPFKDMAVQRFAPMDIADSAFGFTPLWWLLGPQQAVDMLKSIDVSQHRAFGTPIIMAPMGSNVSYQSLRTGQAIVEYTPGLKPELASFNGQTESSGRLANDYVGEMETLIGVNSVNRGNPQASLESGSSLALVQATAVQFVKPFDRNKRTFEEGVAQDHLRIFTTFATTPHEVRVAGQGGSERTEKISGSDVEGVGRVRVVGGNPLMRTLAGKVQIADNMVKMGLIKDAAAYLRVLENGDLGKMMEPENRARSLIDAENEMLRRADFLRNPDGSPVMQPTMGPDGLPLLGPDGMPQMEPVLDEARLPVVAPTDDPTLHAHHHKAVWDDPFIRRNPAVRRALMRHLKEHETTWATLTTQSPGMLEMYGLPLMTSIMGAMAGAPGMAGPVGGPESSQGGEQGADVGVSAAIAPPQPTNQPKMPGLPPGAAVSTGTNPAAPGPAGNPN